MPVLLLLLGLGLLISGWLLLRSFGPGLRIGRLLSATPQVTVAEALELARRGRGAYVRVTGRIDWDNLKHDGGARREDAGGTGVLE